jgi:hypothetical protein
MHWIVTAAARHNKQTFSLISLLSANQKQANKDARPWWWQAVHVQYKCMLDNTLYIPHANP